MRGLEQHTRWFAPQHIITHRRLEKIGGIRFTALKLLRAERTSISRNTSSQIRIESLRVESMLRSYFADSTEILFAFDGHRKLLYDRSGQAAIELQDRAGRV